MAGTTGTKTRGSETKKKTVKSSGLAERKRITEAILSVDGDLHHVFPQWSSYLRRRTQPKSLAALLKSPKNPLLWSVELGDIGDEARALLKRLQKADRAKVAGLSDAAVEWCGAAAARPPTVEFGLECLAWTSALPALSQQLAPELWATLLGSLLELSAADHGALAEESPWDSQLILGELPIALGYFFPEIDACVDVLKKGCQFVSSSVAELLDGSGLTEAQHLEILRKLLACWTRCAWMTEHNLKKSQRLSKAARKQIDWLLRQVLRLTRNDQTYAFGPLDEKPSGDFADMIACALRWTKDSEDRALAKLVLDGEDVSENRLPDDVAYHSEWAEVAVLQPEWSTKSPRLIVTFDNSRVRAELSNRGQVIFSGFWEPEMRVDGKPLEVVSDWEVNIWFSDFDVDFLEIEAELTGGWRIQRQFAMGRQDHFLWAADILLGDHEAAIDYQLITALADGVDVKFNEESRECQLKGRRQLATVCPPALPEWRAESHLGDLRRHPAGMTFKYRRRGPAMYAPLFFDLHRRRMRQPITWRQLTVGEDLETIAPEFAVGYRVQVGQEQWLCYRSLTDEGNRTVLGQNYSEEFALGRILTDGDVEPLVEIAGDDEED